MHSPDDSPPLTTRWVDMAEAQKILGMTYTTLMRRIHQGRVVGEQVERAPGDPRLVWRVRVDGSPPLTTDSPLESADSESDDSPVDSPSTLHDSPSFTEAVQVATAPLERQLALVNESLATANERWVDAEKRAAASEARAETLQAGMEQHILDQLEQTERAVRAEAERDATRSELAAERARSWWDKLLGR